MLELTRDTCFDLSPYEGHVANRSLRVVQNAVGKHKLSFKGAEVRFPGGQLGMGQEPGAVTVFSMYFDGACWYINASVLSEEPVKFT
jgi:hypothetical protein